MANFDVTNEGGPIKLGPKANLDSYTTTEREALTTVPGMLVLDLTTGTLWFTDDAGDWQELGLA